MGTTLTGTTPQDTYDSLIKVTDNGPISGTAKFLSDGLGNDSALALSTSKVGIGTASPTGKLTVSSGTAGGGYNSDYDELVVSNSGRVGINILSSTTEFGAIIMGGKADNTTGGIYHNASTNMLSLATQDAFRLNIDNAGHVAIGTTNTGFGNLGVFNTSNALLAVANSTSYAQLQQNGSDLYVNTNLGGAAGGNLIFRFGATSTEYARIQSTGGISFNGDTAAANALDDYEEGTWTMGLSFGGAAVGVTTSANTGTYTKIGRQVTVNGLVILTSKGSSTGIARITGLPFTIGNAASYYTSACLWLSNVTFANQYNGVGSVATTTIGLEEVTEAGTVTQLTNSDFANNSEIILSLTYFV